MIDNNKQQTVERSEDFKEESFGIADLSVVLDILRSRLYSDPIMAFVKEIGSNARDAHREANIDHRPIKITLPNRCYFTCKIRDFGSGISPDKMSNVFIKYGASTKRNSNKYVGFFGIGAKTGFAYSDSFSIRTIVVENGKNIERSYLAYIDETKVGKLALTSTKDTIEETGTEISLAVKPQDSERFAFAARYCFGFWKVKPEINGTTDFIKPSETLFCQENKFEIIKAENTYTYDKLYVVVDGIPYKTDIEPGINRGYGSTLVLHFKTGEISISANRELIDNNDSNNALINKRIKEANKFYAESVQKEIDQVKEVNNAHKIHKKAENIWGINLKWNNINLKDLEQTVCSHNHIETYVVTGYSSGKIRQSFSISSDVFFIDDSIRDSIPRARIKEYLKEKSLHGASIIKIPKILTLEQQTDLKAIMEDCKLNTLTFIKTSTLYKKKQSLTARIIAPNKITINQHRLFEYKPDKDFNKQDYLWILKDRIKFEKQSIEHMIRFGKNVYCFTDHQQKVHNPDPNKHISYYINNNVVKDISADKRFIDFIDLGRGIDPKTRHHIINTIATDIKSFEKYLSKDMIKFVEKCIKANQIDSEFLPILRRFITKDYDSKAFQDFQKDNEILDYVSSYGGLPKNVLLTYLKNKK